MKRYSLIFYFILTVLISFSFYLPEHMENNRQSSAELMLAFVTYNDYGNNLYVDNLTIGERKSTDIAVASIENIPPDTSYITGTDDKDTIFPIVSIANLGTEPLLENAATVYMRIQPGNYLDSVAISATPAGTVIPVTFPETVLNVSTEYSFSVYISYNLDTNYFNDTITQRSVIYPGVRRNVLFEEFTSMASISAANNNPGVVLFSNNNLDSLCTVKYHLGSLLGTDSLYLEDTVSVNTRSVYYNPLSIPMLYADGIVRAGFPYSDTTRLGIPFRERLSRASPVSFSVTEERIDGDSIRATIDFNIISPMAAGDYKLRIFAVERLVSYADPPGTNGETEFYDVFRSAFPDANGISIGSAQGSYKYIYTYYRNSNWVDSMIYTLAFIQNDVTKEVINCGKGRNIILPVTSIPFNGGMQNSFMDSFSIDSINAFHAELFESSFPPTGWEIENTDALITFEKFTGANGPSFGGTGSMYMNFYNYNTRGQWDTLYTRVYRGVRSTDTLRFDYAYAKYDSFHSDSLIVLASTDGGATFPYVIFEKGGDSLATRIQTTSNFIPISNNWKTFKYPLSTVIEESFPVHGNPVEYELSQNYPNPFNPSTTIKFSLKNTSRISLTVYDITGREIKRLVTGIYSPGSHEAVFDAVGLASGIYFYTMKADPSAGSENPFIVTKKMMLIK